jgi:hypothetical protein
MSKRIYTPEIISFLQHNVKGRLLKELTSMVNARFGLSLTEQQIKSAKRLYGLRSEVKTFHTYTPEEIRFLKENAIGHSWAEVTALFNERFGIKLSKAQIKNKCRQLGVKTGRTRSFKYDKPIGTEIIENGYTVVKIADPNVWRRKQRLVWEQAHGKIPKGVEIIFLDNNRQNCEIENLAMVSRAERLKLSQFGLRSNNREETLTGIAIARHSLAIHNRLKKMLGTKEHKKFVHERSKRLHNYGIFGGKTK